MTTFKDGWHDVSPRTKLLIDGGKPTQIRVYEHTNWDACLDQAAQFYGEPLEVLGDDYTADGQHHMLLRVAASSDVHDPSRGHDSWLPAQDDEAAS